MSWFGKTRSEKAWEEYDRRQAEADKQQRQHQEAYSQHLEESAKQRELSRLQLEESSLQLDESKKLLQESEKLKAMDLQNAQRTSQLLDTAETLLGRLDALLSLAEKHLNTAVTRSDKTSN